MNVTGDGDVPMSKADEFRANAAECESNAEAATDLQAQAFFREAAVEWRKLADQLERIDGRL
jgi:hypothetical protein